MGKRKKKENYYIPINGTPVKVQEHVYRSWFAHENHSDYLERKDKDNLLQHISGMQKEIASPTDLISVVENSILMEKMHECISLLDEWEADLIRQYYFNGKTLCELGNKYGVNEKTIRRKKRVILDKLREKLLTEIE